MKNLFTERDLEQAISDGIFNERNEVTANPSQVIRWFEEWAKHRFSLNIPGAKLKVGAKVFYVNNPRRTGEIIQEQSDGFNRWIVKWDLTGVARAEYGSNLVSLDLEPELNKEY